MRAIQRLLVANRGEIARRVFRTCRTLDIETVAVYSEADTDLRFVREADVAVALTGNTPSETYLRGDLIIAAARSAGADAVHPGYGFLSENADFARQVIAAGLIWVGPTPESIERMGSKVEAKKLMVDAGVPVLGDVDPAAATAADLPLLVKASAGGGGRGMRVVRDLAELKGTVARASAEAGSAFGDATVFCESYVEHGRHVEVQVWGDHHGRNVSVLGARDCSIQRRHQKVIEEAPPYDIGVEVLESMYDAARVAAGAIGYVGVGTVEFLYDSASERFWFLEMNTRLQVEHPVTECVTGLDLVQLQIMAAEGIELKLHGAVEAEDGHAIEARLYAEDPAHDWQPQSGRLTRFEFPGSHSMFERPSAYGVRVDTGYEAGGEISTHYDAMLAKVIAWGPNREQARRQLASALSRARIHGVRTNRDLLVNLLRHDDFVAGDVSTDFFERHDLATLAALRAGPDALEPSAFAAAVAFAEHAAAARKVQGRIAVGWRNVVSQPQLTRFVAADGSDVDVRWHAGHDGYRAAESDLHVLEATATRVTLQEPSGVTRTFEISINADRVDVDSSLGHVALTRVPRFVDPADQIASGSLLAPMPGTVISVSVVVGDTVVAGQSLLVLEAMKMQHTVSAPHDGIVEEIPVSTGDQVAAGSVLAVVDDAEAELTSEGETV